MPDNTLQGFDELGDRNILLIIRNVITYTSIVLQSQGNNLHSLDINDAVEQVKFAASSILEHYDDILSVILEDEITPTTLKIIYNNDGKSVLVDMVNGTHDDLIKQSITGDNFRVTDTIGPRPPIVP